MVFFYLDLEEAQRLFRFPLLFSRSPAILAFRRKDYLGNPHTALDVSVRQTVAQKFGIYPEGPIRLLTQLSYFGFCFNPVSFYFCFDREGVNVEYIVADVTNTPWNERHVYAAKYQAVRGSEIHVPKMFHVSPFMPMELNYRWTLSAPSETLSVKMESLDSAGRLIFDASMSLRARPLGFRSLARTLIANPLMTWKAIPAIYFQALRLALKRLRFYSHPSQGGPNALTG